MSCVLAAPDVDNAQVVCGVLVGFIFGLDLQPLSNVVPVFQKVGLVLQIAVYKGVVLHLKELWVRAGYITAVIHIVPGIAHVQAIILLMVDPETGHLFP